MRVWTTRWNGKDGYEWDLIGPDSELPVGGLWSDGLTSPHIKFIVDACNAAEQRAQDAADVAGTPAYCAESPRLTTKISGFS